MIRQPTTMNYTPRTIIWKISTRIFSNLIIYGILIIGVSCLDSKKKDKGDLGNTIHIIADENGYIHPESAISGMSHIIFENKGSSIHELMFVKLPNQMSAEEYLDEINRGVSFPKGAIDYSGPGLISPGEKTEMWLSLDRGNYILVCWFKGHLRSLPGHTMLVVNSNNVEIKPPVADATLKMIDFRFELEGELKKGKQVIKVETVGPSMHEVDLFRLAKDKTIEDLREWQKRGKQGPIPGIAVGGVLDNHDIERGIWLKVNLQEGNYVFWCNMDMVPDNDDPALDFTHADAGMFKEISIGD